MTEQHEHVNGSDPEGPQVTLPPAEIYIQQQRDKIAELSVENFDLRAAAEFQAQLAHGYQEQMVKLSKELSELKSTMEDTSRATKRATARKK